MNLHVAIAHDYSCQWCYIAWKQIQRLKQEFDIQVDWRGFELWPAELPKQPSPPVVEIPNRPSIPTRFQLMLALDGLTMPEADRPKNMSTHKAHLATEVAKRHGVGDAIAQGLYQAHWELGANLEDVEVLASIGTRVGLDTGVLVQSIESEDHSEKIIHFDAPAYKEGIFNLPTFMIDSELYAQQPYQVLSAALAKASSNE